MTPAPTKLEGENLIRLVAAEKRQRAETKRRGLPIEPVSVEALWLLQTEVCGCSERCGPLNPDARHGEPDAIVIGHQYARSLQGGHTIQNVRLQRADCNHLMAGIEKTAKAKRDKFTPTRNRLVEAKATRRKPPKIQNRGFQKPDGFKHNWKTGRMERT